MKSNRDRDQLRTELIALKEEREDASTMILCQAMFLHHFAKNHSGDFEDCDVPVCKFAKRFRDHADIDLVASIAEKERAWLTHIETVESELTALKARLDKLPSILANSLCAESGEEAYGGFVCIAGGNDKTECIDNLAAAIREHMEVTDEK